MRKTLIAMALVGVCGGVNAKSEACHHSTNFNVNIDGQRLEFAQKEGDKIEFIGEKLMINNESVTLNKEQKQASLSFQKDTRAMVPKIAKIAVEGAELGIKAATMVMTSLFGDDPAMQAELIAPIERLTDRIKLNITETSFNSEAIEHSIDSAFDDEIEKMLELAITKYSGKIIGNVLSSIFSGDSEEIKDLEFRMENMEREMETYVEANAKELELRANALCDDLVVLESYDKVLEGVAGYPVGGLITQDKDSKKLNGISFN